MLSLYDATVPTYRRLLRALSANLDKAARHAVDHKFDVAVLLAARLYPNMWPLAQQIDGACTHAARGPYRLLGGALPEYAGASSTLDDHKHKIAWALGALEDLDPQALEAAAGNIVTFPMAGAQRKMTGAPYLLTQSLPNFYFHCTTAYDILRHNGVPLVKGDFLGELTFAE